jgi:hypothetical protein
MTDKLDNALDTRSIILSPAFRHPHLERSKIFGKNDWGDQRLLMHITPQSEFF